MTLVRFLAVLLFNSSSFHFSEMQRKVLLVSVIAEVYPAIGAKLIPQNCIPITVIIPIYPSQEAIFRLRRRSLRGCGEQQLDEDALAQPAVITHFL